MIETKTKRIADQGLRGQKGPIVITGASGRVGNLVAKSLLKDDFNIRVVARNPSKLLALKNEGADLIKANFTDTEAHIKAFTGADGVFVLSAANLLAKNLNAEQEKNVQSLIEAIQVPGVKNVVLLSRLGHRTDGKERGHFRMQVF